MDLDDYLPPQPYLAQNRFWLPFRGYNHAVIPLMPRSDVPLDRATREAWNVPNPVTDDDIDQLEFTPFNVGMLCGAESGVTVLEVTTRAAQLWLYEQDLPRTPQWLSRSARYYLFKYAPLPDTLTEIRPGLRLLNDGTFVIYPGSIYEDGRLVYWEDCPDFAEIADLPDCLVPLPAQSLIQFPN